MTPFSTSRSDRVRALLPMLAVHALVALALTRGLSPAPGAEPPEVLKLIQLAPESPPPPVEPPPPPPSPGRQRAERRADPRPEGAASPPNLTARPTEIVAPEPAVRLPVPPPVIAAPVPGPGSDASAGAAPVRGPGTGSGGTGFGTGSGRGGGGAGGGGGGGDGDGGGMSPPRWLRGSLRDSDYPPGLGEAGISGRVSVRYTVETDGRVTGCTITASSGSDILDRTTCALIERRFRFAPSRDRSGRAIRSNIVENHEWLVEELPPEAEERPRGRRSLRW